MHSILLIFLRAFQIEAGPAIFRRILSEVFNVNPEPFGDRHDHICSYGLAKKRVKVSDFLYFLLLLRSISSMWS
jgi:hypothetical protein